MLDEESADCEGSRRGTSFTVGGEALSGFAIRKPPSDCARLKSPSIMYDGVELNRTLFPGPELPCETREGLHKYSVAQTKLRLSDNGPVPE